MTELHIPLCEYCDAELPPRPEGSNGRPRRFCSDAHRQAAYRERNRRGLEPVSGIAVHMPALPASPPPDELVVRTVLDVRAAAGTFARLSQVTRRSFSWRCERAAIAIKATIDDYFPGV